jgi:hypothetical protein
MKLLYTRLLKNTNSRHLKKIIISGLTANKDIYKDIKRKIPHGLKVRGFQSHNSVPFSSAQALVNPITKTELFTKPDLANLFLRGWYLSNPNLVEAVKEQLKGKGYNVNKPEFDDLYFAVDALNREDVKIIDDRAFFWPGGNQISGFDDDDVTIMAALLGWIVYTKEQIEKLQEQEDVGDEKLVEQTDVIDLDDEDQPRINKGKEITSEAKMEKQENKVQADDSENSFEKLFKKLEQGFADRREALNSVRDNLESYIIPDMVVLNSHIKALSCELQQLANQLGYPEPEKLVELKVLKEYYKEKQDAENVKAEKDKDKVREVLSKVMQVAVKKGETPECISKLHSLANELLTQLDEKKHEEDGWYTLVLENKHFLNQIVMAVETSMSQPDEQALIDHYIDLSKTGLDSFDNGLYDPLNRQIIRYNLEIADSTLPKPPKDKKAKKKTKELAGGRQEEPSKKDFEKSDAQSALEPRSSAEVESKAKEQENIQDDKYESKTPEEEPKVKSEERSQEIQPVDKVGPEPSPAKEPKPKPAPEQEFEERETQQTGKSQVNAETKECSKYQGYDQEDINILKLLEHNEPYLAYHLAVCYENKGKEVIVPSALLENLALALIIRNDSGSVAQILADNFEKIKFRQPKSKADKFRQSLLLAAAIRPSIFAFNTSLAGYALNDIHLGQNAEFGKLRKLIYEFMTQKGYQINLDSFSMALGQETLIEKQQAFKNQLKDMLEKAQAATFSTASHAFSVTYNGLVSRGGVIFDAINGFVGSEDVRKLQNLLINYLNNEKWQDTFFKDIRRLVGKNSTILDNAMAKRWIKHHINRWRDLINEGLVLYSGETEDYEQAIINEIFDFISNIKEEVGVLYEHVAKSNKNDAFDHLASQYIQKSLNNLENLMSGNEAFERPDLIRLKNRSLLNIQFYTGNVEWEPEVYDNALAEAIQVYADAQPQELSTILRQHLEKGNFEAYNRILSFETINGFDPITLHDQKEFISTLKHNIKSVKTKIEEGCVFGYITNGVRNSLLSSLDTISISNQNQDDGLNYPLQKHKLACIEQEIAAIKTQKIKEYEEHLIKVNDPEKRYELEKHLKDGNIILFNEVLQRESSLLFEDADFERDYFDGFFNDYLISNNDKSIVKAIAAVKQKDVFAGVDFGSLSEHKRDEAKKCFDDWIYLKNYRKDGRFLEFNRYKEMLLNLGFVDAESTKNNRGQRVAYFDFHCAPIKGRSKTPLPSFGSFARGKYRLVCTLQNLGEEDLVYEIQKVTPDSERAVIVFHFDWMDKNNRLELFRYCKNYQQEFLLLDDAMLIYLMGLQESRFPAFVRLAAPFTYSEPYQTGSSNLPEEMFYGRMGEIKRLKNNTGDYACLIYGGRQLGKTVLQKEVERQFNNPDKKQYAFYIDLRYQGIGSNYPIEYIKDLLLTHLKNIPELVPENIPSNISLAKLVEKLELGFSENAETRVIVFLDESDKFLELDAAYGWKNILPLKGLMENTNKRLKVVFAGLHDVRRTIKIPNNPLAHLNEPICVGPMLDNDESHEARLLVTLPLETLGYKFESEDLVLMILSHCNWYPSFIQEFCSKLLELLRQKKQVRELPALITEKDVSKAYEKSRDRIKEKFRLTLGLDERYNVLANILAAFTIERPEVHISGVSVEEITKNALISWKEGFDNANPRIDIRNLLGEMVDLGVLRVASEDCFALRTANLLEMIGSRAHIEEYLYLTEKTLPTEFKRETSRILYSRGGRERRSPFPASYFDIINNVDNKTIILIGNMFSGLGYVEEFLDSKDETDVINVDCRVSFNKGFQEAWTYFEKSAKKASSKKTQTNVTQIMLFDTDSPFEISDILTTREKLNKKNRPTAIFLMSAEKYLSFVQQDGNCFKKLENHKVNLVNMPLWKSPLIIDPLMEKNQIFQPLKDWFSETGCNSVDIRRMFRVTGAWHYLIDHYHERIYKAPELWEDILSEFESEILEQKDDYISQFGIKNTIMHKLILFLIEFEEIMNEHMFVNENEILDDPEKCEEYLFYFQSLSLIDRNFEVDEILKKLITHG